MCTIVSKQVQVHGALSLMGGCVVAEAGCLLVGHECLMARLTTKEEAKKRHACTHIHTHTRTCTHSSSIVSIIADYSLVVISV